jgi:hypothetical protein
MKPLLNFSYDPRSPQSKMCVEPRTSPVGGSESPRPCVPRRSVPNNKEHLPPLPLAFCERHGDKRRAWCRAVRSALLPVLLPVEGGRGTYRAFESPGEMLQAGVTCPIRHLRRF